MSRASSQWFRESEANLPRPPRVLRKLYAALDATDVAGDRTELRILRRLQFAMAVGSMPMIAMLGAIYAIGGHGIAGVIADHVPGVTVVFADIVGFTPLAAELPPTKLVALLDEIFSAFDQLAREHRVEKIKTIGDAYMAVAGTPEPCSDHAARAARLALAMRDELARIATRRGTDLRLRIGLHTGEVVAGVIGIERFSYDLWGDTVNTASRMESHGQPGQIQITATTRAALGDQFVTRERGSIEVKGRGSLTTYWLDGAA